MAKTISLINTTDTFQVWLERTNDLLGELNSSILTASVSGSDTTVGNATLVGTFTANTTITNSSLSNSLSVNTIQNRTAINDSIVSSSPIRLNTTVTTPLVLKTNNFSRMNFINNANVVWSQGTQFSGINTPYIIQIDGSATPQFSLQQSGNLIILGTATAAGFAGSGASLTGLNASNITTGTIADVRIPELNASKITAGTFADARIPDLNASKITAGTFADARIPNLNASKITAGTFADARIPTNIVRSTRSIQTAGGIAGGGDLSANRTIELTGFVREVHDISGSGLVVKTESDQAILRSINGTANQITVANGGGVNGNPTISAVIATFAEATAGTNTTKLMTAQRVAQAITQQTPTVAAVQAVGALGTYAMLGTVTQNFLWEPGDIFAGNQLFYASGLSRSSATAAGIYAFPDLTKRPSGQWRAMSGHYGCDGGDFHGVGLFLRIS